MAAIYKYPTLRQALCTAMTERKTGGRGKKRTVGSVERCFGIGADVLPCYPLGESNDPCRAGFVHLMTLQRRFICGSMYPTLRQWPFGEKCVLRL